MKKIFVTFVLLIFFMNFNLPCLGKTQLNYYRLYEKMPVLDFMYETGYDPDESEDYEDYIISPYVLIRLPVKLMNQKTVLSPGYYLVKPEKKFGYNFVIFKQKGKVVGLVPIYKEYRTNPLMVFPEPSKPKHKWYIKPFVKVKEFIQWPFKKLLERRKPLKPPRAKVEFELIDNNQYYDMSLYIEDRLYKMLFKLKK